MIHSNASKLAYHASYLARYLPALTENKVKNPVFLIGCARSGTTKLAETIASHKDIATFPTEALDLWHPKMYPWHTSTLNRAPFWKDPATFTAQSLNDWTDKDERAIKATFGAYQSLHRKPVFFNKTAMVSFMIPHILNLFPDAKFIHIYRDGRAVALSYTRKEQKKISEHEQTFKQRGYYPEHNELLEHMAHVWNDSILEIEKQKQAHHIEEKGRWLEFNYEDFCTSPQEYLEKIARFLNIEPNEYRTKNYNDIKSRNYKFKETFTLEQISQLNTIMKPALELKGYSLDV